MSGDNQADPLNLDAFGSLDGIEAKAREEGRQLTLALVAEVRRLRAQVGRVETLIEDETLDGCECGHWLSDHNGLGCYARLSYTPLVSCACILTDDRTHFDLARINLRAALAGP